MPNPSAEDFLREASSLVDVASVLSSLDRLGSFFSIDDWVLPLPPWARRSYTENGNQAWEVLHRELRERPSTSPMCIYAHIPFCSSKCGFCDSYSFKLGNHRDEHIDGYVELLRRELVLWSKQGDLARRPISTVHLGGGTPSFLGIDAFTQVIETCAANFNVNPYTEWALESTVTHLTSEMLNHLHAFGFRRLHLGVQSLEDPVRGCIGRRGSARDVLAKIEEASALGWIVTVDLICGLPVQTLAGFLHGILELKKAGTDGFSLYELLIYPQNRQWSRRHGLHGRTHIHNFLMFLAGGQVIEKLGYRKNLFNHWANSRDDNRYFTFPTRGEDLLAVGTIADGVFGTYHYRHPRYQAYRQGLTTSFPGLEGGLRRNEIENRLQPITTAVLSGRIRAQMRKSLLALPSSEGIGLPEAWFQAGLIETDSVSGDLVLTGSGSWFAGNLIRQVEEASKSDADLKNFP